LPDTRGYWGSRSISPTKVGVEYELDPTDGYSQPVNTEYETDPADGYSQSINTEYEITVT